MESAGEPSVQRSTSVKDRHRLYINGEWRDSVSGNRLEVINPATEEVVEAVPYGGWEDAEQALAAATRAFAGWRRLTPYERGAYLRRAAELIRERAGEIGRWLTLEEGKTLGESVGEARAAADLYDWFAEEGKRSYGRQVPAGKSDVRRWVLKQPVGVCAAISPWNFPLVLASRKIAAALAAGCTIVSRPASQAPVAAMEMFGCFHDAGFPPGVVNHVLGTAEECAEVFLTSPLCQKISFTGSTEVGKELLRRSADSLKKMSLELGGSAPVLIFPDVDVNQVAEQTVIGKFRNMGQSCIGATRFYVHEDIFDEYVEEAVSYTKALRLGNGLDPEVDCGPLFERRNLEKTESFVEDAVRKGAHVLTGGKRPPAFERGYYYEPTVLTNIAATMRLTCEEVFGPLMPLMKFSTVDEGIRLANDSPYGLAAYVFTHDLSTVIRTIEGIDAGVIGIGEMVPNSAEAPFGGLKQSGLGRECGSEGLEAYLESKTAVLAV